MIAIQNLINYTWSAFNLSFTLGSYTIKFWYMLFFPFLVSLLWRVVVTGRGAKK